MTETTHSPRPEDSVELAALRILCLVCHFGAPDDDLATLWGERRLHELDHLLRHPETLALVVIDHLLEEDEEEIPAGLANSLRDILRPAAVPTAPRRVDIAPWRPMDDALAFLTCRDLLRLASRETAPAHTERGYIATAEGFRALAELSSGDSLGRRLRGYCRLLSQAMSSLDSLDLEGADRRLHEFLLDERIAVDEDPAPRLFHSLFGEPL